MCGTCGCHDSQPLKAGDLTDEANHHSQQTQIIQVEQNILADNQRYAKSNASYFSQHRLLALNLLSSPGSGKTTLLETTIRQLGTTAGITVIEGDQYSQRDADRIRALNVQTEQVNTGRACHLDAHRISQALDKLHPKDGLLFIENVGNLVCPALFPLGEHYRVVLFSVTEGDDKPLKYQEMFARANVLLMTKIDLLPYVDFNREQAIDYARRLSPSLTVFSLSCKTGEGVPQWIEWLKNATPLSSGT